MPVITPPTQPVQVFDPGLPFLLSNGPTNLMIAGDLVYLTFTSGAPAISELLAGAQRPHHVATVVSKLLMPRASAEQLATLLNQQLAITAPAAGTA